MLKVVIIGYGSAGRRHAKVLKKNFRNIKIYILTKQKIKNFQTLKSLEYLKVIDPNYIIIASETYKHLNQIKFLEKNFKSKKILVEKPLYHKFYKVNYNLRFHPFVQKFKKILDKQKIYDIKFITNSYLPNWRPNSMYKKNYAVSKNKGGGVILDLSHELDLICSLFNKIKIEHVSLGKKSNLTKDTEDFLKLLAKSGKISLTLDLNYYSRNEVRLILADGKNSSFYIDLKKNIFKHITNKKTYIFKKMYSQNFTFLKTHQAILNGNNKHQLCKLKDALNVLKIIKQIKNF